MNDNNAMADRLLPSPLVARCMLLVAQTHKTVNSQALPRMIATRRNAVATALLPEGRVLLEAALSVFRIRLFLWFAAITALLVAAFWTWWFACATAVALVAERIMAAKEREFFIALAATLLGAEMLKVDFAGWGRAYPNAREKAMTAFGSPVDADTETEWLDFYLPRRGELDTDTLKAFGPSEIDEEGCSTTRCKGTR